MARDALGTHTREELGISKANNAQPVKAAIASAASFVIEQSLLMLVAQIYGLAHDVSPFVEHWRLQLPLARVLCSMRLREQR